MTVPGGISYAALRGQRYDTGIGSLRLAADSFIAGQKQGRNAELIRNAGVDRELGRGIFEFDA